ncbi:alpha-L-rhamnosidase [Arcticibacter tournemirensis]|uniref:alpha-L-rhamnosidase n=1 Tax=Arcticibacter tournemirensis TaxID=699437 RepID=A0A5M9HMP5_9SPHI|nr:glycoside hydrolase family 78 protein [Arcticibacter tournemirensis]KAA8486287.1 Bacterial alpha-L-rhamnosidase [Arcticibacter tournemirensis]TQM52095.1 alpha-L-rhamnosidase [Arcticibacter tournemirensis]
MKHKSILYLIIFPLFLLTTGMNVYGKADVVSLQNLRTELLVNPVGIDVTQPRLSWEIRSAARATVQTAYQVLVASSEEKLSANEGDLWNSGKVGSDASVHVKYNGTDLKGNARCYWKVKVWTNKGESAWSSPATFTIGLLNSIDWKGRWIGMDRSFPWDSETQWSRLSARYLRKEFETKKTISRATAYIIGLGLYELYLNGQKVGDQVLAPGPTDYFKGVKYNAIDVTGMLKPGKNAVGTILGNGRYYTMRQAYKPYKIKTFGYPKMLFNLLIEYSDGSNEAIVSDDSWKLNADGPIRSNNEYDGEEYDANKEMPGWNTSGFDDSKWLKATFVQEPGGTYEAQMNENMKVMATIKPVSIKKLKANTYILDMGQNFAGWLRMRVKGSKGDTVKLRFGEDVQANGELYVRNLRDARSTDVYILKGGVQESWEPTFVYHGFRFVEITGYPGTPAIEDFDGRVIYDDMKTTGGFLTSDATINQVYKNAKWGILSNYKGMPVDCPQRNERQPWLGDRTTGAYGESFIFDNSRLYAKWLDDIRQSQKEDGSIPDVAPAFWRYYSDNVTWPSTYMTIADMLYRQYGDFESIRKHYDSMKKWMDYMAAKYTRDGLITKDKYGDWCVPPESKEMIHSRDPKRQTDGVLLASATYVHASSLMGKFAKLLNKNEDAAEFAARASAIKDAFNKKFFDPGKGQYSNNTITANLLPLVYGIVPENSREKLMTSIADKIMIENKGHIGTGVIGTQWLMRGLTANGRPDIAYRLASNRDYPSWGYMAENGATTIWELWNGNTANPEMNSANHVMLLGDLVIWYYENVAGIKSDPDAPAFKKIIMKPEMIDGLTYARASYQSVHGLVKSDWKKAGKTFIWNISVPANTRALVYIPASSAEKVKEGKKAASASDGLKFLKMEGNRALFEAGSGDYSFTSNM